MKKQIKLNDEGLKYSKIKIIRYCGKYFNNF